MPKVFVSYRRDDSAYAAVAIFKRLAERLGPESVILDVDTIPPGTDWRRYLTEAVAGCDVLLALIGDHWLEVTYQDGPKKGQSRLYDPEDFVRFEIETALRRGITVIPVLVGQASIPRQGDLPASLADLVAREAAEVRAGRDLDHQLDRLASFLERFAPRLAPTILNQLMSENATRIQIAFLQIPEHRRTEYFDWLLHKLRSAEEGERLAALMALAQLRHEGLDVHLRRAAVKDLSAAVRRLAVHYIGQLRMRDELGVVSQLMSDGNQMVRAAARQAYQQITGRSG